MAQDLENWGRALARDVGDGFLGYEWLGVTLWSEGLGWGP